MKVVLFFSSGNYHSWGLPQTPIPLYMGSVRATHTLESRFFACYESQSETPNEKNVERTRQGKTVKWKSENESGSWPEVFLQTFYTSQKHWCPFYGTYHTHHVRPLMQRCTMHWYGNIDKQKWQYWYCYWHW